MQLASGFYPAGIHNLIWDASGHPGGIYFYRLQSGDEKIIKRMLLVP